MGVKFLLTKWFGVNKDECLWHFKDGRKRLKQKALIWTAEFYALKFKGCR